MAVASESWSPASQANRTACSLMRLSSSFGDCGTPGYLLAHLTVGARLGPFLGELADEPYEAGGFMFDLDIVAFPLRYENPPPAFIRIFLPLDLGQEVLKLNDASFRQTDDVFGRQRFVSSVIVSNLAQRR